MTTKQMIEDEARRFSGAILRDQSATEVVIFKETLQRVAEAAKAEERESNMKDYRKFLETHLMQATAAGEIVYALEMSKALDEVKALLNNHEAK